LDHFIVLKPLEIKLFLNKQNKRFEEDIINKKELLYLMQKEA